MEINVRDMTHKEYELCMEVSTKQQALDRASVSGESYEVEYDKLKRMIPILLPKGLESKNHFFYSIDGFGDKGIGYIWCGSFNGLPENSIFLFDIHLLEQYRSRGIGRIALENTHKKMMSKGYNSVLLNVLNNNFAKKLYTSLGYFVVEEDISSTTMQFCFDNIKINKSKI